MKTLRWTFNYTFNRWISGTVLTAASNREGKVTLAVDLVARRRARTGETEFLFHGITGDRWVKLHEWWSDAFRADEKYHT